MEIGCVISFTEKYIYVRNFNYIKKILSSITELKVMCGDVEKKYFADAEAVCLKSSTLVR